jgi:ribosomal protein L11 methyltransferase
LEWHKVIITTTSEAMESITYMLYEMGIKGVEIIDNNLTNEEKNELIVDYIDNKIEQSEDIKIQCYFSEEENITEILHNIENGLQSIKEFVNIGKGLVEVDITNEEDWANNWKAYYKPFKVGNNILIKPTWEDIKEEEKEEIVIEIDPGMAFGSGTHETTSMCIELIQQHLKENDKVIDVGSGSGILGIAAAKLGASHTLCIDVDKNAVKVAKENVIINKVENKVDVICGDLLEEVSNKAEFVIANIMADIIIYLTKSIKKVLKNDGIFISSGIIVSKVDEVKTAIIAEGFEILDIQIKGEWTAITARLKE